MQRPSEAKKPKTEENVESASGKWTRSVIQMSDALRAYIQAKSDDASIMLRFESQRGMSLPESTLKVELRTLNEKVSKLHCERKQENEDENLHHDCRGLDLELDPSL